MAHIDALHRKQEATTLVVGSRPILKAGAEIKVSFFFPATDFFVKACPAWLQLLREISLNTRP